MSSSRDTLSDEDCKRYPIIPLDRIYDLGTSVITKVLRDLVQLGPRLKIEDLDHATRQVQLIQQELRERNLVDEGLHKNATTAPDLSARLPSARETAVHNRSMIGSDLEETSAAMGGMRPRVEVDVESNEDDPNSRDSRDIHSHDPQEDGETENKKPLPERGSEEDWAQWKMQYKLKQKKYKHKKKSGASAAGRITPEPPPPRQKKLPIMAYMQPPLSDKTLITSNAKGKVSLSKGSSSSSPSSLKGTRNPRAKGVSSPSSSNSTTSATSPQRTNNVQTHRRLPFLTTHKE